MSMHLPAGTLAGEGYDVLLSPERAGWTYCGLRVIELAPGGSVRLDTGGEEMAVLPLRGSLDVVLPEVRFSLAGREGVFQATTDWCYVPIATPLLLESDGGGNVALCSARATRRFEPAYVPAEAVSVEVRGAGPSTRQVNNFMSPQVFAGADKLMCVEVLTPDGNWSSYPPHRHDDSPECPVNNEEVYYFRVDGPPESAFALHRTYVPDGSIDERAVVHDGDVFVIHARLPRPDRRRARLPAVLPERARRACRRALDGLLRRPGARLGAQHLGRDGARPALPDDERDRPGWPRRELEAMKHQRMTTAQAIVAWLTAQRTVVDGAEVPLFPGVFAIFGHGNVTALGHALAQARESIPTWRGQNEQGMALAAVAYAKAMRRRQVMVATSSIGPGATNMVTAAGVAMANRLPLLMLSGDTFSSRVPDPVLQQVEHPGSPSTTVNDAFRAVVRYWDRIVAPEQVLSSLPRALGVLLDPAECGPAFVGLPQDVQAQAFDCPERFLEPVVHEIPRPRPDRRELLRAASALLSARRPLVIAGGGVHYALAEAQLSAFAAHHCLPVVETVAGKSCLVADDPALVGPIGVTGADGANALAARCDVVLALGTRLQDFTTGSWTVFGDEELLIVAINAARFDAEKHGALPVVGDALAFLEEIEPLLAGWRAPGEWAAEVGAARQEVRRHVAKSIGPAGEASGELPSYAEVIGRVHAFSTPEDYLVAAAGGLPGELSVNWLAKGVASVDIEYGFSCMGYEISGGWGAAMARARR